MSRQSVWFGLAAIALSACQTSVPSLVDRLPQTPVDAEEMQAIAKWTESNARPGTQGAEPATLERVVLRATLTEATRWATRSRAQARIPGDEPAWLVRFRVDEILEGSFESDELGVAVRSPLEEFAYPISETVAFTLTLERSPDRERLFRLIEISPTGPELIDRARQATEKQGRDSD